MLFSHITERRKKLVEARVRSLDISSMLGTVAIPSKRLEKVLSQVLDLIKIDEFQYYNIAFQLHN